MRRIVLILSIALACHGALGQGQKAKAKPMSDSAMDQVTAGSTGSTGVTATASNGVVNFAGQAATPNGLVTSAGTLSMQTSPLSTSTTTGTLSINGSAQQGLSSLININAVNSQINVLMNLTINVNSTVGSILQSNLNGKH